MNPTTLLAGCFVLGYGLFTAIWRVKHPEKFTKLEPMKRFWGERGGLVVHFIGYTIVPVVIGIRLIVAGVRGFSLFELF
jgi:hypothetical protein